jgi:hypothetical protein
MRAGRLAKAVLLPFSACMSVNGQAARVLVVAAAEKSRISRINPPSWNQAFFSVGQKWNSRFRQNVTH